ncbi:MULTISPECIES: ABC transporter substrate-binding protein [unclassified Mesotoga]|jgi:iron(III) transport system substrate-binding protein|uniref:ABC transporter substrate-binding protein n=1 Tax=unclassified Mesotoga TaxID=1184398 RepID=UPI000A5C182B|nr:MULTISPECIES: ABC transporter substrate-binding protein [unclassified Mesotoga]
MRRFLVLITVICVAFSVTLLAADSFTVYTTLEELAAKELFDKYEEVTGIRVDWVRLSGGEAEARMEAEKLNPQASIWVGGVGLNHISAKLKGLTTPYFSRAAANTPEQYKDPEGYWIGLYLGPLAFATHNGRAAELGLEPPKGWFDILDSKYENLVRVANPNTSGTAYNLITCMISLFGGDEDLAFLYLKKLDRSIEMYTRSGSAGGKSVAIGEIPFAIGYAHDMVKLKAEGADITITVPEEGTGFEIASMSLIKGGPDPVNAKKLYDWILTEEAQAIIAGWYVIPVSRIAPKHPLSFSMEEIKTVHQDYVWDAENKERLLDRWTEEIGGGVE